MESTAPSAKRTRLAAPETHEQALEVPAVEEPPLPGAEGDAVDSISRLPDEILGEIISLLPTKDGGRTQILASRWRYLWRTAPLNFDHSDLAADDEYMYVIPSSILAVHQGPGRRFRVPACFLWNRATTIDAWLRSPVLDNLEELEFYILKYRSPQVSLPASISRFSSTLRIATFSQCNLPDDTVETLRFPLLRKLALVEVKISDASLHKIIATGCPGLECLMLSDIFGSSYLRINSPCIRSIAMRARNLELVIEDAPLLQCLIRFGYSSKTPISVISAPKLETLALDNSSDRHVSRVVFGSTIIQGLGIANLTTVVRTVKTLAVDMRVLNLDTVIDFLRFFPYLEKLYIQRCDVGGKNLLRRKHRNFLRSSEIRLKAIKMAGYRGIRAHVNFMTFFVLNARSLESMTLEIAHEDYNQCYFAEQRSMLQMEERASRVARLYFKKFCQHDNFHEIKHVNDLDLTDPFECRCGNLSYAA